jgi:methenyltetrahydromethanopterin cyclohydrolase
MYFFCETDKAIPLPIQQQMAQMLGAAVPTFTSDASHSPFLSQPQKVVEGLEYDALKVDNAPYASIETAACDLGGTRCACEKLRSTKIFVQPTRQ